MEVGSDAAMASIGSIRRELRDLIWLRKTTYNDKTALALEDRLHRYCYGYFDTKKPRGKVDDTSRTPPRGSCQDYPYGSVFNVEFTPAGNAVLAVHSNKAITVHDTNLEKRVLQVPQAHSDCVNVLTFLDDYMFVTGSDDGHIKVWDLRKLSASSSIAVLKGHTGWIKNVEHDKKSGHLFSIAFEDGIRKWNLARMDAYKTAEEADNMLFTMNDGVRMRLSPDGSVMAITHRYNYLFVISNFDGSTISSMWNYFPRNFPPSETDKIKLEEYSKDRTTNIPSIHAMSTLSEQNYRSLLSLSFHPSNSNLLATRVIDVKNLSLSLEMSLLYDVQLKGLPKKPFYSMQDVVGNILKYHDQNSSSSVLDYIKEISFSSDGRILATPQLNGVQLLAVDSHCTPIDLFYDDRYSSDEKLCKSLDFNEVGFCTGHEDGVLTCKLNSTTMTLASGCVGGRVIFNTPRL